MKWLAVWFGRPLLFLAGTLPTGFRSPATFPVIGISSELVFAFFLSVLFPRLLFLGALALVPAPLFCVVSGFSLMGGSVCVEGKTFVAAKGGGAFPFRITEFSRRRRFSVLLNIEEFRWLAVELVRFCSSKGDPFWVRTFRWNPRCWLLQLRKNANGRFIMLSHFAYPG